MADQRDLLVRIIGDDRSLQAAFTRTERRTKQVEGRFSKLNQSLRGGIAGSGFGAGGALLFGSGAFVGTAAITTGITATVTAASDLNEQITKSRQIFGQSSDEIEKWSRNTARSIGVSQTAALEATGTFGNLFRTVELAPRATAEMSRALVELAADLASFNNSSPEEVLTAIRSGLIGEAEPLRRFGVLLSEARVQQEALAVTGKKTVASLTDQDKLLARYRIILEDTIPAQGDFTRTSGSLANQSRTLKANLNDLAANMGKFLLPVMSDAAEAANLLFIALDKFRGVDFSPGFEFPEPPGWLRSFALAPISPAGAAALAIKKALEGEEKELKADAKGPGQGIGEDIARRAEEQAEQVRKSLNRAERARERQRKDFADFTKGLGLKLDKAGLTQSLEDDIAVLRELERALLRQMRREGRTFALVQQLTEVRLALQSTVAQRAEEQAQRSRDAFQDMLDALDLKLERARGTARLGDDLRVLNEIERSLRKRISEEGKTLELERQLLDVRQQQAEIRRQQAEQLEESRQARQFRALGLTEEGEERGPSVRNLRKRLASLREQIEGTVLDTPKTQSQLDRISKVLAGKFGKVGKDVRRAILEMFNDISSAFKEGDKKEGGQVTRGGIRSITNLIKGLGLTPEQEQALRDRARPRRRGTGAFGFEVNQPSTASTFTPSEREQLLEFNIFIDGKEVEAVVTRRQQKRGRRGAPARRGRAGGRNL